MVDRLDRASESLILNLADGARLRSAPSKLKALDYALGSGLECAACLDVASLKGFLSKSDTDLQKQSLVEIIRMLIGLRKAWSSWEAHDDSLCTVQRHRLRTRLRCSIMKSLKYMAPHSS